MASLGCLAGWGALRCPGRLTPQPDILRLMTRGFARSRRSGSGSARISVIAWSCAAVRLWGGKSRVGSGAAAGGAEASDER
jgi:hypothetical protein